MNLQEVFSYPIKPDYINRKKKSLKKELENSTQDFLQKKIAILGGSTTSEIKNILDLFLLNNGIKASFYESAYNQYFEEAVFSTQGIEDFSPDIIYIHTTVLNISTFPEISFKEKDINQLVENEINKFKKIWDSLQDYQCSIIQNNFEYTLDRPLGNLDCYDIHGRTFFINKINSELAYHASKIKNLYLNDINYLSSLIGLENWFDRRMWYQAKFAISVNSIPLLAHNLTKIINSILGNQKKCLTLDLDNTCWGGIIGDDGIEKINLGSDNPIGESYVEFQKYINELKNRGILLAINSKNDIKHALQGLEHPDSVLKETHFEIIKANWDAKDKNLKLIAQDLNIALQHIVFIDDSPLERDLVTSQLSSVSVPNIQNDSSRYIDFIDKNGFFEPISLTEEDIKRASYYSSNNLRAADQSLFDNYTDFLSSLSMVGIIRPFDVTHIERIHQLINKTNQFNLTTRRYEMGELISILDSDKHITLFGKLNDKYGENGIVSILIGEVKKKSCHLNLFLLSCRVFNRTMEHAMFNEFVKISKEKGLDDIYGYYYPTKKNQIVKNLFDDLGFQKIQSKIYEHIWKLDIESFSYCQNQISIQDE